MTKRMLAFTLLATLASAQVCQAQAIGRIAFLSGPRPGAVEISVIDSDGGSRTSSIAGADIPFSPYDRISSSPDGSRIATRLQDGRNWDIFVMDADGTNQINITQDNALDRAPAWSPDGSKIAFSSQRGAISDIYVIDADGGNLTRLTDDPAQDETPAWSPDGSRIVFASKRDGNFEIYVMDADGSNEVRLTDSPREEYTPDWSPDGNRIAFFSDKCLSGCAYQSDIMVMGADGGDVVNLTNSPAQNGFPSWSPDGSQIAFASDRDAGNHIFVMQADGSAVTNLTGTRTEFNAAPAWLKAGPSSTAIRALSWGQAKMERR